MKTVFPFIPKRNFTFLSLIFVHTELCKYQESNGLNFYAMSCEQYLATLDCLKNLSVGRRVLEMALLAMEWMMEMTFICVLGQGQ